MITPAVGTRQSFAIPFRPISSIGTGHIMCRSRTSKYCALYKKRTTFMAHLLKEMTHPNSIDENHIETIPDGPKTEEI
jgi:hypothetical protein